MDNVTYEPEFINILLDVWNSLPANSEGSQVIQAEVARKLKAKLDGKG